jgi:hypothetical protein
MVKLCTAGQTTDDNMAHAHFMLETQGYKHTQRLCDIYCFSTATVVALTRFVVTSHRVSVWFVPRTEAVLHVVSVTVCAARQSLKYDVDSL